MMDISDYEQYIKEFHSENVINLLNEGKDKDEHVSIHINLDRLKQVRPNLFFSAIQDVWSEILLWNKALLQAQISVIEDNNFLEPGFQIKENCHVRFVNLNSPQSELRLADNFPTNKDVGKFLQVKGSVVRITKSKILEFKREYICNRCKEIFTIEAQYKSMYIFDPLTFCRSSSGTCKGVLVQKADCPLPEYCMNYQEIRMQELCANKTITTCLIVTLDNDLVDYCQPGEFITVCGTIEHRWQTAVFGKRLEGAMYMRGISIYKDEEKVKFGGNLNDQFCLVLQQWQETLNSIGPLNARDKLINSICPEIYGMYLVKLAIALSICSGIETKQYSGTTVRGSSHLLLVGDPGLGKSKLLKAASQIAVPSIHTTGFGCSAAGLTAAAIQESGEWQLEGGALVLADGGTCCIDEFNLMSEDDKSSIHEAMEQQSLSIAKVGLVCQLKTRCAVIAATNPKNLYKMSDIEGTNSYNIGMGSPLLSRFDIVLILRDERDPDWDLRIIDHVVKNAHTDDSISDIWSVDHLQSHFIAARQIVPQMSVEASTILKTYFKICRSDKMRDVSRTSMRLLNSLNRLAQANARLMLRSTVEPFDAIIAITLMESSYGFGRILKSVDNIKSDLPLDENQIQKVMSILGLPSLTNSVLSNFSVPGKYLDIARVDPSEDGKMHNVDDNWPKRSIEDSDLANNSEQMFGFNMNAKKLCVLQDKENSSMECLGSINISSSTKSDNLKKLFNDNESKLSDSENVSHKCPANRKTNDRNTNLNMNLNHEGQEEFEDFDMDDGVMSQILLLETQEYKKDGDIEKKTISDITLAKLHQFKNPNRK